MEWTWRIIWRMMLVPGWASACNARMDIQRAVTTATTEYPNLEWCSWHRTMSTVWPRHSFTIAAICNVSRPFTLLHCIKASSTLFPPSPGNFPPFEQQILGLDLLLPRNLALGQSTNKSKHKPTMTINGATTKPKTCGTEHNVWEDIWEAMWYSRRLEDTMTSSGTYA